MERAVALCRLSEIIVDDLPPKLLESKESMVIATAVPEELITIDEMARRYTRQVLATTKGNKSHAARILGIDRRSLYRRLETLYADKDEAANDEISAPPVSAIRDEG